MKVIITEDKLYKVFSNFMDTQYDLSYNINRREFIDRNNRILGWIGGTDFFYGELSDEQSLKSYFGKKTNKMLLTYLKDRFPKTLIDSIENYEY